MARKSSGTPPYVPRKGLRAVLSRAQLHKTGDVLTRDELHKRGLSSHWTYPALAALRFLDILDDSGRLTGKHLPFNEEKPDTKAQQAIIKKAYETFFKSASIPAKDQDELKTSFRKLYNLSERVTNSAFPAFLYLAEGAGIELLAEDASNAPREVKRVKSSQAGTVEGEPAPGREEQGAERGGDEPVRIRHTGYQVVINLQVTKYTNEKDLMRMIRTANRAIHLMKKSGDKYS